MYTIVPGYSISCSGVLTVIACTSSDGRWFMPAIIDSWCTDTGKKSLASGRSVALAHMNHVKTVTGLDALLVCRLHRCLHSSKTSRANPTERTAESVQNSLYLFSLTTTSRPLVGFSRYDRTCAAVFSVTGDSPVTLCVSLRHCSTRFGDTTTTVVSSAHSTAAGRNLILSVTNDPNMCTMLRLSVRCFSFPNRDCTKAIVVVVLPDPVGSASIPHELEISTVVCSFRLVTATQAFSICVMCATAFFWYSKSSRSMPEVHATKSGPSLRLV